MRRLALIVVVLMASAGVAFGGAVVTKDKAGAIGAQKQRALEVDLLELFAPARPVARAGRAHESTRAPTASAAATVPEERAASSHKRSPWRCHREAKSREALAVCLNDKGVSSLKARKPSVPPALDLRVASRSALATKAKVAPRAGMAKVPISREKITDQSKATSPKVVSAPILERDIDALLAPTAPTAPSKQGAK